MDSYLEIAHKVLSEARQPLCAREMLKAAYQMQIVPNDLYGKTQHKTLQARLSTDILKYKKNSKFFRTGPGLFYLRSLLDKQSSTAHHTQEYIAPLRSEQLGRFDVLTFLRNDVFSLQKTGTTQVNLKDLVSIKWKYRRLSDLKLEPDTISLQFLIIIFDGRRVALNKTHTPTDESIFKRLSFGFEGIVRKEDRSLFSNDSFGLTEAAIRTLTQQFSLSETAINILEESSRWSFPVTFYETAGPPGSDDLLAIISFQSAGFPELIETIDDLETMEWATFPPRIN
ncbi:winged helix-turn-helix domain-containing protein, partial [Paraglaciecola sp.]